MNRKIGEDAGRRERAEEAGQALPPLGLPYPEECRTLLVTCAAQGEGDQWTCLMIKQSATGENKLVLIPQAVVGPTMSLQAIRNL